MTFPFSKLGMVIIKPKKISHRLQAANRTPWRAVCAPQTMPSLALVPRRGAPYSCEPFEQQWILAKFGPYLDRSLVRPTSRRTQVSPALNIGASELSEYMREIEQLREEYVCEWRTLMISSNSSEDPPPGPDHKGCKRKRRRRLIHWAWDNAFPCGKISNSLFCTP